MTPQTPSPIMQFLPLIAIFIIFYFLLIRPQKNQQMQHKKMVADLKKNDEVITSSGIYGTIINVKDTSVVLRIDDNVKIEIQKDFIAVIRKSASA